LPIKAADLTNKAYAKNLFEIYLNEDFLDYYLKPEYDKHFNPEGTRVNQGIAFLEKNEGKKKGSPGKHENKSIKEKYIADENNKMEDPLEEVAMQSLNTHGGAWTNREEVWILEDRRLLFSTKS